jgi:hypothetical protein
MTIEEVVSYLKTMCLEPVIKSQSGHAYKVHILDSKNVKLASSEKYLYPIHDKERNFETDRNNLKQSALNEAYSALLANYPHFASFANLIQKGERK